MEVKVGVQYSAREISVETTATAEEVHEAVLAAVKAGDGGLLDLTDERGRRVLVPVARLAYVEIGEPESRRVGFGG